MNTTDRAVSLVCRRNHRRLGNPFVKAAQPKPTAHFPKGWSRLGTNQHTSRFISTSAVPLSSNFYICNDVRGNRQDFWMTKIHSVFLTCFPNAISIIVAIMLTLVRQLAANYSRYEKVNEKKNWQKKKYICVYIYIYLSFFFGNECVYTFIYILTPFCLKTDLGCSSCPYCTLVFYPPSGGLHR